MSAKRDRLAAAMALALILGTVAAAAQSDPSAVAAKDRPRMPGSEREPGAQSEPPAGSDPMAAQLKQARPQDKGGLPPPAEARNFEAAGGPQVGRPAEPKPAGSTLKLVLRMRRNGESQVLSATELAGQAPAASDPAGDFLYEVTEGDQTLTVRALPDPFEGHSYGGPIPEHFFIRLEEATIVVDIPMRSLESPLERLNLRLYRLQAGPQVERLDAATVDRLKQEKRLQVLTEIPGARLASEIRKKASRVEH